MVFQWINQYYFFTIQNKIILYLRTFYTFEGEKSCHTVVVQEIKFNYEKTTL